METYPLDPLSFLSHFPLISYILLLLHLNVMNLQRQNHSKAYVHTGHGRNKVADGDLPSAVCGCRDCACCHLECRNGSAECRIRSSHDRSRWRRRRAGRKRNLFPFGENRVNADCSRQSFQFKSTGRVDNAAERAVESQSDLHVVVLTLGVDAWQKKGRSSD